jgi:hypothetical protein
MEMKYCFVDEDVEGEVEIGGDEGKGRRRQDDAVEKEV